MMNVENHTRIIRHLFYRTKLVSVTQFSPRLMDFCSSPRSIANLRRGNEGEGRGEGAQRDEQKETLKSEQNTTAGERGTEETERQSAK